MERKFRWVLICLLLISEYLHAQTYWGLDSSFNGTGFRIEPNPTGEYIGATLTMTDGRIVVAGTNINGPSGMLLVRQYLENGDPDPSFGTNGYAMANYRQVEGVVLGLGMQSTGKIILAGGEMTNQVHPIVERLLPNGDLDTSFGQSGIVDIPNAGGAQYGMRVFVLPDDRIVIGYRIGFPPQLKFGSCRLLPDGEVDLTYGVNGFATMVGPSGSLRHNAVAMDAQYRLIFAGPRGVTIPNGNYLARMDSSGFADSSFGVNGYVTIPSGMFNNDFQDVVCHPNGSCYPLGFATGQPVNNAIAIGRYFSNGDLDTTFGTGGLAVIASSQWSLDPSKILVDAQGDLVIVGSASLSPANDFLVARMHPDGTLDTGLSPEGWRRYHFSPDWSDCHAGAFDDQGRLIMAGNTLLNSSGTCTVARVAVSSPLAVEEPELVIWPNIVTDGSLNIGFSTLQPGALSYVVVDLQGREVAKSSIALKLSPGRHSIPVSLNGAASGLYLLQVTFNEQKLTQRLIVE